MKGARRSYSRADGHPSSVCLPFLPPLSLTDSSAILPFVQGPWHHYYVGPGAEEPPSGPALMGVHPGGRPEGELAPITSLAAAEAGQAPDPTLGPS